MPDSGQTETHVGDRHFSRGAVLDNIEALVVAVILALVLRCFIVEAFAIPTGSMGPTLYGDHFEGVCKECGYRFAIGRPLDGSIPNPITCPNCGAAVDVGGRVWGGDRILVNKLLYRFEKPRRWDPFVFVNPTLEPTDTMPKTTYIKRLIALPSETLEVIRGDIVINGQIQRKTTAAQRSLWLLVYDSRWPWKKPTWLADTPGVWSQREGESRLSVDAREQEQRVSVRFAGHQVARRIGDTRIYDHYGYDPEPGFNVVTDLSVSLDVTPASTGKLILELPEDARTLSCVLPVEGSSGQARLIQDGASLDEKDVKLPVGKPTRVRLTRVDYLITVEVGGTEVLRKDMWSDDLYRRLSGLGRGGALGRHDRSGVNIVVEGLKADFDWIRIDRDIYYGTGERNFGDREFYSTIKRDWEQRGGSPFGPEADITPGYIGPIVLNDDQYVAMGDNSPESSDSRYWGPVPEENLIGKALVVWWYPTRIRLIH